MKPGAALLAMLAGVILSTPACGRKSPPRPPELVAPETITTLTAQNRDDGILLGWKRPRDYVDGSRMLDLASFTVERSANGGPFEVIVTLSVEDRDRFRQIGQFRYLDSDVQDGILYEYRVYATTLDGYSSARSPAVSVQRVTVPQSPAPTR